MNALKDETLYDAIACRMLHEEEAMDTNECLAHFKGAKRVFYIADCFDCEINNGGISQYFLNSSRLTAPDILDALQIIGAHSVHELLSQFLIDQDIDPSNPASFPIEEQDDFDSAYYDLPKEQALMTKLTHYIRAHLKEFTLPSAK